MTPGTVPARRSFFAFSLPTPSRRATVISTVSMKRSSDEEARDGVLFVGAAHRLAEEGGDREPANLGETFRLGRERDRVGDDELVDVRALQARDGGAGENGVGRAREDGRRAGLANGVGRGAERAPRVHHIVDDDGDAGVDVADDVHLGHLVRARAALVDDGEVRAEALREGARALDAPRVGRDDGDGPAPDALLEILEQDGCRVDVVDGDVEEALDLARVEVEREHARGAGRRDEVGDELRADRHARRDLPVLARVAVVRDDRRDALGRRPLEGVEHEEQLHQVVVRRPARGLDDEDVAAAHVLGDLDLHLAVAEAADLRAPERYPDLAADGRRERAIRAAREYLDLVLHPSSAVPARWAGRSRTFDAGSKVRCLTSLATAQGAAWPPPEKPAC